MKTFLGAQDVSETNHFLGDESKKTEASEQRAIISEGLNVSETVADYPAPNNKNNSKRENVDEKEIEPAHAENNRRKDPGMWFGFSTDDKALNTDWITGEWKFVGIVGTGSSV